MTLSPTASVFGLFLVVGLPIFLMVGVFWVLIRGSKNMEIEAERKKQAARNPRKRYYGPPFKVWQTVYVPDMERKAVAQSFQVPKVINKRTKAMLLSEQFPYWRSGKVSLVRTTPYDLGFEAGCEGHVAVDLKTERKTILIRRVLARAKSLGLKPCHPVLPLFLRLQLDTKDKIEVVVDPVSCNDTRLFRCILHYGFSNDRSSSVERFRVEEFVPIDEGDGVDVFTRLIFALPNE